MTNFIDVFEDIRSRFFLEEEDENVLIQELIAAGKEYNHNVFLFQSPNMSGYDLGFVPHGIKPKDADKFITSVLGCGYVCKFAVTRNDNYHIQIHGTVEDPRCKEALTNGNIMMIAALMHIYDFNISLTRAYKALRETSLIEVGVEKDRLYYGDLTRNRRVLKHGVTATPYKGITMYTLGDVFCKYLKAVQRKKLK